MQNSYTGQMQDITKFLPDSFQATGGREQRDALQAACDKVEPDRTRQGPVFAVGEIIEIRGGRFQITKIEPGHMRLKSLPSK